MTVKSTQPLKGFRDRYPEDKAFQEYLFATARAVAQSFGFQEYDGPLVEPLDLYVGKTSRELLEEQAFTLTDRNGEVLMLRPEMTPSLARMVAARAQQLVLPIKLFSIGLRYRYEAPQRGRDREFYQLDFDILGADGQIAEIELLRVIVALFNKLGATDKDFTININSRAILNSLLTEMGIAEKILPDVVRCIDRKAKVTPEAWDDMVMKTGVTEEQLAQLKKTLSDTDVYSKAFEPFMHLARAYGIDSYITINPEIVRGLDYYTGLVFEVTSLVGTLKRSLLGGGRYANLVEKFGSAPLSGIGCAPSDTVIREFLIDAGLFPENLLKPSQVLVTVFSEEALENSIATADALRRAGIATELYPALDKLPKQLKYADRKGIQYVVVIGPDEMSQNTLVVKNMADGTQRTLTQDDAITLITQ